MKRNEDSEQVDELVYITSLSHDRRNQPPCANADRLQRQTTFYHDRRLMQH